MPITANAVRSAPPPPDTLPISPVPAATLVHLHKVSIDPKLNPRSETDPEVLASIHASMIERLRQGLHPQEMPVWAVAAGPDRWELRAGWTRAQAIALILATPPKDLPASSAAWLKAPTLWVSAYNEPIPAILSLRENIQRSALPMHDVVMACAKIQKDAGTSTTQIAREIGMSDRTLGNMLRVYRTLTPEQWQAYVRRAITMEQAIRLAAIHDDAEREAAFQALLEQRAAPKPKTTAKAADDDGAADGDDGGDDAPAKPLFTPEAAMGVAMRAAELPGLLERESRAARARGHGQLRTVNAHHALKLIADFVLNPNKQLHESSGRAIAALLAPEVAEPKKPAVARLSPKLRAAAKAHAKARAAKATKAGKAKKR